MTYTLGFDAKTRDLARATMVLMASAEYGAKRGQTMAWSPEFPVPHSTLAHRMAVLVARHCGCAFSWGGAPGTPVGRFFGTRADVTQAKRLYDDIMKAMNETMVIHKRHTSRIPGMTMHEMRNHLVGTMSSIVYWMWLDGIRDLSISDGVAKTKFMAEKANVQMYTNLMSRGFP